MERTRAEIHQIIKTKMETSLGKKIDNFTGEEWKSYQDYYSGFFDGLKYTGVEILE